MKIRSVGAEFFRADGERDITKLKVDFRNFANAPINGVSRRSLLRSLTQTINKDMI